MTNPNITELCFGVYLTGANWNVQMSTPDGHTYNVPTPVSTIHLSEPRAQLAVIAETILTMRNRLNPDARILGVGLAVAAAIKQPDGEVTKATALHRWIGQALGDILSELLGAPVVVQNDAVARTLWLQSMEGIDTSFYAHFVGHGNGGALYRDGSAINIEPGHLRVPGLDGDLRPCVCGKTGCLDAYASGALISAALSTRGKRYLAPAEWNEFAIPIAEVIAAEVRAFDVDTLVIGGWRYVKNPGLASQIKAHLRTFPELSHLRIVEANLDYLPVRVALELALKAFKPVPVAV